MATPTSDLDFQNFFSTTLTSGISATDTSIPLDSVPNGNQGFLVIDPDSSANREVIFYTSKTGSTVECASAGDGRGQDDTSASAHSSGVTVICASIAGYFEALQSGAALSAASITPGKWTNPYSFRAIPSAATTLTDATYVKVTFGTEQYDYNNNFASSTYTVPVDGVYHFDALVSMTPTASPVEARALIYKNGSAIAPGPSGVPFTASNSAFGVSSDLLLAAGDTIEIYGYQNSAGDETTIADLNTYFNGHLVHVV